MAEEITQEKKTDGGLLDNLLQMKSTMFGYLHVRLQLLGAEAKGSLIWVILTVAFAAIGMSLLFFLWPLVLVIVGYMLFEANGGNLVPAVAWIAVFHFAVACLVISLAIIALKQVKLKRTVDEFKKDQEWINSLKKNS